MSVFNIRSKNSSFATDGQLSIFPTQARGIFFHCMRWNPEINKKILPIYQHAIKDKAIKDMIPHVCAHNVTGNCGNMRKNLSECRCAPLDRMQLPHIRKEYEDTVIKSILDIITTRNGFELRLGISCAGGLLGEEVLLFKLIDRLKKQGYSGKIALFIIDKDYENPIRNQNPYSNNRLESVGGAKNVKQFLKDLCKTLPPFITVEGAFFDSHQYYLEMARANPYYQHDLLIGEDIEQANGDMGLLSMAGKGRPPIALIKNENNIPQTCEIGPQGQPYNCITHRRQRLDPFSAWKIAIALIIAGALGAVVYYSLRRNSRNTNF